MGGEGAGHKILKKIKLVLQGDCAMCRCVCERFTFVIKRPPANLIVKVNI